MNTHTHIGQTANGKPVTLTRDERLRHMAVFGSTGVGKTTFLQNIVAQDIARGDGLLVIDPHGDFAERALTLVPPSRNNQVCYFNLTDSAYPVGFNILEDSGADQRAVLADGIVSGMRAIWIDMWGPRLEQVLRHSIMALIETPNASLALLPRLLTDADFRVRVLSRVTNPLTRAFFEQRFNSWRDDYREQAIDPVLNKIDAFLFSPAILNVIGQAKSALHFEHAMARKRVVIANLARGMIGETPSNLMGALLLARVQAAGMARASLPHEARHPFHIIIDEVQLFGTEVIVQILSEARKYGLSLTMATQFMAGLSDKTLAAVMGNVAALIVFRVGYEDATVLAPEFDRPHQTFNPYALRQLPRGEAMVRISSAEGELVEMHPDPLPCGCADRVKGQSRIHYGVARDTVEDRLKRLLQMPVQPLRHYDRR
jgi:Helicase HerA, central domain